MRKNLCLLLTALCVAACDEEKKPEPLDLGVPVETCDVLFTELMVHSRPSNTGTAYSYLELYNPASSDVDLDGCVFDLKSDSQPTTQITLKGEKAVLGGHTHMLIGSRYAPNADFKMPLDFFPSYSEADPVTMTLTCRENTVAQLRYRTKNELEKAADSTETENEAQAEVTENDGLDASVEEVYQGIELTIPVQGVSFQLSADKTSCNATASNWCLTDGNSKPEIDEDAADTSANADEDEATVDQLTTQIKDRGTPKAENEVCAPAPDACQLKACDVFFSEVLVRSNGEDALDQFVEFANVGNSELDLQGCEFEIEVGKVKQSEILQGSRAYDGKIPVAAGGVVTIGPANARGVDARWTTLGLLPSATATHNITLRLKNPDSGETITEFVYASLAENELKNPKSGASFQLCQDINFSCQATSAENWSYSDANDALTESGSQNRSTRGALNRNCVQIMCTPQNCDGSIIGGERAVVQPKQGELSITEIYPDEPTKGDPGFEDAQISDGEEISYEWFEISNSSDHTIDLNGLGIFRSPNAGSEPLYVFEGNCLAIEPGQHMVVAADRNPARNGGQASESKPDHMIGGSPICAGFSYERAFTLPNTNGTLVLAKIAHGTLAAADEEANSTLGGTPNGSEADSSNTPENIQNPNIIDWITWGQSVPGHSFEYNPYCDNTLPKAENCWNPSQHPQYAADVNAKRKVWNTAGESNDTPDACYCIDANKWKRVEPPAQPGDIFISEVFASSDPKNDWLELHAVNQVYLNCGEINGIPFLAQESCKPIGPNSENDSTDENAAANGQEYVILVPPTSAQTDDSTYALSKPMNLAENQGNIVLNLQHRDIHTANFNQEELVLDKRSAQLDPNGFWCPTQTPSDENNDTYHSKGAENKNCPASYVSVQPGYCIDSDQNIRPIRYPSSSGSIVFSEYLPDPEGLDMNKEWIELYIVDANQSANSQTNPDGQSEIEYDLNELELLIRGGMPIALGNSECLTVSPGDFVLLVQSMDPALNGLDPNLPENGKVALFNDTINNTPIMSMELNLPARVTGQSITIAQFMYQGSPVEGRSISLREKPTDFMPSTETTQWQISETKTPLAPNESWPTDAE